MLWIIGGVLLAVAAAAYYVFATQRQPEVLTSDSGMKVLVTGRSGGGMDARISGRLTDVLGCAGIESGSRQYLAVWPSGTNPLSRGRVRLPDDSVAALGELVVRGGGFIERKRYAGSVPTIPESCAAEQIFLFNTVNLVN